MTYGEAESLAGCGPARRAEPEESPSRRNPGAGTRQTGASEHLWSFPRLAKVSPIVPLRSTEIALGGGGKYI